MEVSNKEISDKRVKTFRLGLRVKFTLLVTILLLAVFAAQSYVIFDRNLSLARQNLSNEVKTYTNLSALPIGSSYEEYYAQNHFRFGEIIQAVLVQSNQTIKRLQIFNTNGDLLFDSKDLYKDERENVAYKTTPPKPGVADEVLLEQLQKIDPTYNASPTKNSEIQSIIYPFLDNYNKHVYSIKYFISYDRIYQNLAKDIVSVGIVALLSLGLASILIIFFVTLSTLRPIGQVAKAAKKIEAGDLSYSIKVTTKDEIEDLAYSVYHMAQSLLHSQQDLIKDKNIISAERNKLSIALSSIADGVIGVDMNRKVVIFNKAAEDITALRAEEVIGLDIDSIFYLYSMDKKISANDFCPIRTDQFAGILFNKNDLKLVTSRKKSYVNLISAKIRESSEVNLGCLLTL